MRRKRSGRRAAVQSVNDPIGGGCKEKAGLKGQHMLALIAVGGALLMMMSPGASLSSARKAVNLWLFTVLPSMLPFFICTDLLIRSGMHVRLGNLFERPLRRLYGVPGVAGFVYISSILSGYPTGAKVLGELHEQGQIGKKDVRDILTFCSTSGPLFILGAVGSGMLRSQTAGYIILTAHYIGSLLTGLFMIRQSALRRTLFGRNLPVYTRDARLSDGGSGSPAGVRPSGGQKSVPEALTESILSSFQSLMVIGGYIVIFMILTDAVKGVIELMLDKNGFYADILTGCFEMTVGCSGAAASAVPAEQKIVACTFLVSFGGISIAAQSMSVLKNAGVRLSYYLRFKLLHGLISSACAYTIIRILLHYSSDTIFVFESAELPAAGLTGLQSINIFFADGTASLYSFLFSSSAAAVMMIAFYLAVILFSGRGQKNERDGNHSGV